MNRTALLLSLFLFVHWLIFFALDGGTDGLV